MLLREQGTGKERNNLGGGKENNYNSLLINVIEKVDKTTYGNVWVKNEDAGVSAKTSVTDVFRKNRGLELKLVEYKLRLYNV